MISLKITFITLLCNDFCNVVIVRSPYSDYRDFTLRDSMTSRPCYCEKDLSYGGHVLIAVSWCGHKRTHAHCLITWAVVAMDSCFGLVRPRQCIIPLSAVATP